MLSGPQLYRCVISTSAVSDCLQNKRGLSNGRTHTAEPFQLQL